jgi:hypothetical protein
MSNNKAITEMYPRIPWEVVADTLGSTEHILGTTELPECKIIPHEEVIHLQLLKKTPTVPLYGHTQLAAVFTGFRDLSTS